MFTIESDKQYQKTEQRDGQYSIYYSHNPSFGVKGY